MPSCLSLSLVDGVARRSLQFYNFWVIFEGKGSSLNQCNTRQMSLLTFRWKELVKTFDRGDLCLLPSGTFILSYSHLACQHTWFDLLGLFHNVSITNLYFLFVFLCALIVLCVFPIFLCFFFCLSILVQEWLIFIIFSPLSLFLHCNNWWKWNEKPRLIICAMILCWDIGFFIILMKSSAPRHSMIPAHVYIKTTTTTTNKLFNSLQQLLFGTSSEKKKKLKFQIGVRSVSNTKWWTDLCMLVDLKFNRYI